MNTIGHRRYLIGCAAALFSGVFLLGGCANLGTLSDLTLSQSNVDSVMSGYDVAFLAPAKAYRDLYDTNPCQPGQTVSNNAGLCAQKSVVQGLQKADKVVEDALKAVQSQLDQCKAASANSSGCKGVGALYATLKSAIAAAESYATNYGVKQHA